MVCLQCPNMACKVYYPKAERWTGYCTRHHRNVTDSGRCGDAVQLTLFDTDL